MMSHFFATIFMVIFVEVVAEQKKNYNWNEHSQWYLYLAYSLFRMQIDFMQIGQI